MAQTAKESHAAPRVGVKCVLRRQINGLLLRFNTCYSMGALLPDEGNRMVIRPIIYWFQGQNCATRLLACCDAVGFGYLVVYVRHPRVLLRPHDSYFAPHPGYQSQDERGGFGKGLLPRTSQQQPCQGGICFAGGCSASLAQVESEDIKTFSHQWHAETTCASRT